jgi:hypothetical protein
MHRDLNNVRHSVAIAGLKASVCHRLEAEARNEPSCRLLGVAHPKLEMMKSLVFPLHQGIRNIFCHL